MYKILIVVWTEYGSSHHPLDSHVVSFESSSAAVEAANLVNHQSYPAYRRHALLLFKP